jgi:hypothetical protein
MYSGENGSKNEKEKPLLEGNITLIRGIIQFRKILQWLMILKLSICNGLLTISIYLMMHSRQTVCVSIAIMVASVIVLLHHHS